SGREEEAVSEIMRAVELDPLNLAFRWTAGIFCYLARQYERASLESRKCFEIDQSFALAWSNLVLVLAKQGQDDLVISRFEQIVQVASNNQLFLGILGHYYATVGRCKDAQRVLDQLHELSVQRWVSAFWPAVINACLGRMDEAFACMHAA